MRDRKYHNDRVELIIELCNKVIADKKFQNKGLVLTGEFDDFVKLSWRIIDEIKAIAEDEESLLQSSKTLAVYIYIITASHDNRLFYFNENNVNPELLIEAKLAFINNLIITLPLNWPILQMINKKIY